MEPVKPCTRMLIINLSLRHEGRRAAVQGGGADDQPVRGLPGWSDQDPVRSVLRRCAGAEPNYPSRVGSCSALRVSQEHHPSPSDHQPRARRQLAPCLRTRPQRHHLSFPRLPRASFSVKGR
ncbi:hypothetical protein HPP92_000557 [Vanilla planifolia]|uniref:Uncharacterized protein n=1 Tax=Vanilla planifolia TaxID=51239 RepID=A0A835VKK1_VANPL|nr:hypothetical protein HPP92_000557 [Vanilla planifolia]